MRVCLMIEGQEGVGWDEWLALAAACEEHGLEGLFRSDHYVSVQGDEARGSLDAWAVLAGLAARTERIRLGTLVSPVTFRHPAVLARMAVAVDHISGGRVELGMGAGWFEREHRAQGFDFPPPSERMRLLADQLEIVHGLWGGDHFTFEGLEYRLEDGRGLPRPVQDPHPPLIVGGRAGPRSAELAARWADEYNTIFATPDECRRRRARVAEAFEGAGREDFVFSLMTACVIGADRREVLERARRVMDRIGEEGDPESFLRGQESWIVGTPDEVAARLDAYADAGVGRVMLQHPVHEDVEMVALLGAEVLRG